MDDVFTADRPVRSRYTLAEKTVNGRGILCNTFTGAIDLVDDLIVDIVQSCGDLTGVSDEVMRFLTNRGYFVGDPSIEDAVARHYAKLKKQQARKSAQPKYMFALTLRCNLACDYCWQVQEHRKERQATPIMDAALVDAAFHYIAADLDLQCRRDAFISLFGGEPLLDKAWHHEIIGLIGDRCQSNGYHLHFTTNGRQLAAFEDEVRRFRPSIQVTVDGYRRSPGGGKLLRAGQELTGVYETLHAISQRYGTQIFLRFLVSEATCDQFSDLAEDLYGGKNPSGIQLAVAPIQNKSFISLDGVSEKYKILDRLLKCLHGQEYACRIAYIDWRSLNILADLRRGVDTIPDAFFHHCEANVNLTCFDYKGNIFACYEGIGNAEHAVGTYYPQVTIDREHLSRYRDRDAFTMQQCSACALSPICGGGCEVRAQKKFGTYEHPFCDGLHSEIAQVLRNWGVVYATLRGGDRDGQGAN